MAGRRRAAGRHRPLPRGPRARRWRERPWLGLPRWAGEPIESVLIPEGKRRTLCISSQVGCALGCVFCATGQMGWRRNLSPAEIAGQVRETVIREPALKPTNVVFMGMGEPLLNWEHVDASLTILNHPLGLGIGARHITVSTVGILPNLAKLARRPEQFRLALSLHAPTPAQRLALMPIEKKYTLADVLAALRRVPRPATPRQGLVCGGKKFPPQAGAPPGARPPPRGARQTLALHPPR